MSTIESLELEISSNSKSAAKGIDKLTESLKALKNVTVGKMGLSAVAKEINEFNKVDVESAKTKMVALSAAISTLSNLPKSNLAGFINPLKKIPEALEGLKNADMSSLRSGIQGLVGALTPMRELAKSNLSGYISSLKKIPKVLEELSKVDMGAFADKLEAVATAMKPLATEMEKISNGFSAMPSKIQKLIAETDKIPSSNKRASESFTDLYHKMKTIISMAIRVGKVFFSMIKKSMEYTETFNLFEVSMGEYASEALAYAEEVSAAMGIDPKEWMEAQGIFMTLAKGFGVAGDRANEMSKNLTQLSYDLASFYNKDVEEMFLKLKSGLAGELEPLRAIGYDLSQAKLEATALALGIDKAVDSMTQAEKAELRYYAIMTQVTDTHGDMARTLDSPANQFRVLKAEINMTAREIGNVFIPAAKRILPVLIAITRVVKSLASTMATLVGYEPPELAEGSGEAEKSTDAVVENLKESQEEAKKLKSYMLGFDELNVINPNSGEDDGSSSFTFDMPDYGATFLSGEAQERVNQMVEDMKEWLGITGEIDSWADLFDTKLGKILITVGAIGGAFLTWKVVMGIVGIVTAIATGISKIASLFGGKDKGVPGGDLPADIDGVNTKISETTAKLKGLVKNLALGIVVIAEVIVAAALIVGAIWGLGLMLEQVGIAWQPVIDNAATIAIAMGVGTGLLAAIGVAAGLLGMIASAVALNIALGAAILLEIGVVAAIFLVEIWAIGKALEVIGEAWQPVIDNGETIATAIAVGTALLIGIGIVAALLGVASVAGCGLLPLAIGLGTAMLVLLEVAFVNFTESLIVVAQQLKDRLHPELEKTSAILPALTENMRTFTTFMGDFAIEVVRYSKNSSISGISSTISNIIGFFTGDPIAKMTKEVESQNGQFDKLIAQLEKAIPKIKKAVDLTNQYNSAMSSYGNISGGSSSGLIGNTISGIGSLFGRSATNSFSMSVPAYATGGFPEQGQMFIAREAGAEMVGNIGRKTAVANNDQIVSGIAGGVAEANEEQNALLREQNLLLRSILEKDNSTYLDGRRLTESVEKHQRERGRVIMGGVM